MTLEGDLAALNPFAAYLRIVADPLRGEVPDALTYLNAPLSTVVLFAIALPLFARYRARAVYWLCGIDMASITLTNATVEIPIYNSRGRSFRNDILRRVGGRIEPDNRDVMTVKAVNDTTLSLKPGDRFALIGHNGAGSRAFCACSQAPTSLRAAPPRSLEPCPRCLKSRWA